MEKTDLSTVVHDERALGREEESSPEPDGLDLEYLNDPKRNRRFVRRIDIRAIPLLAGVYLLNYLDRGNVGNAKVLNQETGDSLLQRTHMNAHGYAVAISMFSVAYGLFEVPSNWVIKRFVRPSRWLGFLLFAWGALTIGFAGVQNYAEVVVVRMLIGVFEAGFFPGMVYYVTFWYRVEERSLRVAFFAAHATLAGAFGGSIAYGVGKINGAHGLEGFRWLFIIEGVVTILCAFLLVLLLPNFPSTSRWLSDEEKKFAEDRLKVRGGGYTKDHASRAEILACFSPRMLAHYFTYILDCVPLGSFTFFAPTIVTGLGYKSLEAQLLTIPPWVVGYIVALTLSFSADHFNARGWHATAASVIGGTGWLIAGILPHDAYVKRYGCLVMAAVGAFPVSAPLTAWVTCNVPSIATMAIATGMNNTMAGVSQIIAQWIWRADEVNKGYPTGNFTCAACSYGVAIMAAGLRLWYARMNRLGVRDAKGEKRIWAY